MTPNSMQLDAVGSVDLDKVEEQFAKDGFVCLRAFFSKEEIDELRNKIDKYTKQHLASLPEGDYVLEADGKSVRNLWRIEEHDPEFLKFAKQPKVLSVVSRLVHGEPVLKGVETFNKPARVGSGVPAHQDNSYFCQAPPDVLTFWIAIDPATVENGTIFYMKGSHKEGVWPHQKSGVRGNSMGLVETPPVSKFPEYCAKLQPGDVLIHHSQTVHRSEPNTSQNSRLACLLVFRGSHTQDDPVLMKSYR